MKQPEVSVLMATHDRAELLEVALGCFMAQRRVSAELLIVDDSTPSARMPRHPLISLLRVAPGTPLGVKLNMAAAQAQSTVLAKWDDDDYYGPYYLTRMMEFMHRSAMKVIFAQPFLFYDLLADRLHVSDPQRCSGATLTMPRQTWLETRFQPLREAVDATFLLDVIAQAGPESCLGYDVGPQFIQLRHANHLWNHLPDGRPVREYLAGCAVAATPVAEIVPETVLGRWAGFRKKIAQA